ncbi:M23 family metallopeptidase [Brevibacillus choshinensis]|uniref:M23 family metallopeptidase n=1 Tax=Brevibacillus choshinensis TaxID=54911 RepID=A0ABX7FJJ2_BRECH|nr:M23 family metallopeptidase [Brevibacillus choshinensis]QRG66030.1 M23 family metallopeptidase [Brevibacillus choshinensis]
MEHHQRLNQAKWIPAAFLAGKYQAIYEACSGSFREQLSLEEFGTFSAEFHQGVTGYQPHPASIVPWNNTLRFVWLDESGQNGLSTAIDRDGTILGLRLAHLSSFPKTDETFTKGTYHLPFRGEWFTYWGGTNELVNYHYAYPSQRYAFDFLVMRNGRTYSGDPKRNDSYYAFGMPILAPASGTVLKVSGSIWDNEPGSYNEEYAAGNFVEIDHGNGEYSLLAHLKHGSVTVKPGVHVERGQVIGQCGNSGNSREPHLHMQVSDSSDLLGAHSIRIRFADQAQIVQGDFVRGAGT